MKKNFKTSLIGVAVESVCIYFLIEVLAIVEALHSVNIIHADLKPDNFLLRVRVFYLVLKKILDL